MSNSKWTETRMGHIFAQRKESGISGLPTLSVTIDKGLVRRDSFDRKMETTLEPEEHLLIRKGDIAYNMMRMWQGASGLASEDGIVSPAYVVVTPSSEIDSDFAAYLFKSPRNVKHFKDYSYGITGDRLRLYYKDFAAVPVSVPSLKEQRRIGGILKEWDEAIALVEERIRLRKQRARALHRMLITNRLVEHRSTGLRFGDIALGTLITQRKEKSSDIEEYPLHSLTIEDGVTQKTERYERSFLLKDKEANEYAIVREGDFVVNPMNLRFGAIARSVIPKPVAVSAYYDVFHVSNDKCDPVFLELLLKSPFMMHTFDTIATGSLLEKRRVHFSELRKISISLPPLAEQQHVAAVLGEQEMEIRLMGQQIVNLKKQKEGLMQNLLSGKVRASVDAETVKG